MYTATICPSCGATMSDDDTCPDCVGVTDVEAFGEAIRGQFPELVSRVTEGMAEQVGDEELVIWDGYGFRIRLSDGSSFDIQINQRDYPRI